MTLKVLRLDHVGIAVRDLRKAARIWEILGLSQTGVEDVPSEKVRVAILPVGETRLELLQAAADDSAIASFLEKRGEGIHHIALEVEDIRQACDELRKEGLRLVYEEPRRGEGGALVNFVHPSSTGGVLVELREGSRFPR